MVIFILYLKSVTQVFANISEKPRQVVILDGAFLFVLNLFYWPAPNIATVNDEGRSKCGLNALLRPIHRKSFTRGLTMLADANVSALAYTSQDNAPRIRKNILPDLLTLICELSPNTGFCWAGDIALGRMLGERRGRSRPYTPQRIGQAVRELATAGKLVVRRNKLGKRELLPVVEAVSEPLPQPWVAADFQPKFSLNTKEKKEKNKQSIVVVDWTADEDSVIWEIGEHLQPGSSVTVVFPGRDPVTVSRDPLPALAPETLQEPQPAILAIVVDIPASISQEPPQEPVSDLEQRAERITAEAVATGRVRDSVAYKRAVIARGAVLPETKAIPAQSRERDKGIEERAAARIAESAEEAKFQSWRTANLNLEPEILAELPPGLDRMSQRLKIAEEYRRRYEVECKGGHNA